MHGGPRTNAEIDAMELTPAAKLKSKHISARAREFYATRNIDIGITYDFPQNLLELLRRGLKIFWVPKASDYEAKGVINVTFCRRDLGTSTQSSGRHIKFE
jgi:hypothetical protein